MCADPITQCRQCGHTYHVRRGLVCPKCKWEFKGHPLASYVAPEVTPVLTKEELLTVWGALQHIRSTGAPTAAESALYEKLTEGLKM